MQEYFDANKELWNNWTGIHSQGDVYGLESFRRGDARGRLKSLELQELGDVQGKSMLHLQCHFGMDTLSWARLGAEVTGADFSEKAIELARSLSAETGIPGRFVLSNVYDLPQALSGQFDVVFTSYGVLGWLPDLHRWGQVIGHFLKPGGTFYIAEVHPFVQTLDDESTDELKVRYPYFMGEKPMRFDVRGSYASPDDDFRGVEYGWNHTMGQIVDSLIQAGMRIDFLHEHTFCAWQALALMEKGEDGWWRLPAGKRELTPLMFSVKATKTG